MNAAETKLQKILEGTSQYCVPHYQRPYVWSEPEWEALWQDVDDLCEESEESGASRRSHFLGSLVTMPGRSVPEGISKWILIDGQQRITTLQLFLAALRDCLKLANLEEWEEVHEQYLINRFKKGNDRYKVLPTHNENEDEDDRRNFIAVIDGRDTSKHSKIARAYAYFYQKLKSVDSQLFEPLMRVVTGKLVLVSIVLEENDNPYSIFESLNAKGRPLSQADLIRNYFFMRVNVEKHDALYTQRWKPMENALGHDVMPEFMRHFLMKEGDTVRTSDVYMYLKSEAVRLDEERILCLLDDLQRYSTYYASLVKPELENDEAIRVRLERLNRLQATVTFPFLLNVWNEYANSGLTSQGFIDILDVIENFLLRRYVCSVIRGELNRMFAGLFRRAKRHQNLVTGVREILSGRNYPSDTEFRERLRNAKLYGQAERLDRVRYLIERLERARHHREAPDMNDCTVEHLVPQHLNAWWQNALGSDAELQHESLLHTLGNLTLTAYNQELSNSEWPKKARLLADSNIEMNRQLGALNSFGFEEIKRRGQELADWALTVWPHIAPGESGVAYYLPPAAGEKPEAVVILGEEQSANSWQEVLRLTLKALSDLGNIEVIQKELPKFFSQEYAALKTPKPVPDHSGLYYESALSAQRIYDACLDMVQAAGLSRSDWLVKYRE